MPQLKTREYRSFELLENKNEGKIITGYACTFDSPYPLFEDSDGTVWYECIDKRAFNNCDLSDVILQYDHVGKVYARVSNGTLKLSIEDKGLKVEADLSTNNNTLLLYEDIESRLLTKMSMGFIVDEDEYDHKTKTRYIRSIKKLYDVSVVSIPANNNTYIEARSRVEGAINKYQQELLEKNLLILEMKKKGLNIL